MNDKVKTDFEKTPAVLAGEAAEKIRMLNHATLRIGDRAEWEYPSHASEVVGALRHVAAGIDQALAHAWGMLWTLAADGHVRSDRGQLAEDLELIGVGMSEAREAAELLRAALSRTHSRTQHLAWRD